MATLEARLAAFISAVGADIKALQQSTGGGGGASPDVAAVPRPSHHGFKAWTMDPALTFSQTAVPGSGTLHGVRIYNPTDTAITISSASVYVVAAGASLTNVGFAVYGASGGAPLTSSVNSNGATTTLFQSVGAKTVTFATQTIPANSSVIIAFWFAGTTLPSLSRASTVANVNNFGLVSPNMRYFTANTGLTNTAPATLGTQTAGANAWWLAVS